MSILSVKLLSRPAVPQRYLVGPSSRQRKRFHVQRIVGKPVCLSRDGGSDRRPPPPRPSRRGRSGSSPHQSQFAQPLDLRADIAPDKVGRKLRKGCEIGEARI